MITTRGLVSTRELERAMQDCYGTEGYHKIDMFPYYFTDGVTQFCETADAFWFLTDTFCYIHEVLRKTKQDPRETFLAVYLKVSDKGPADLIITDGDNEELKKHHYTEVSVPAGEWVFFFEYGVFLWHMEH